MRQIYANALVEANVGRSAIMRGPLVYRVESTDNEGVRDLRLAKGTEFATRFDGEKLGGIVVVTGKGSTENTEEQPLYSVKPPSYPSPNSSVVAIPYFANANRGPINMMVWLPQTT